MAYVIFGILVAKASSTKGECCGPMRFDTGMPRWGAIAISVLLLGCDPEGRKECVWVLEPEPKLDGSTDAGMIPVCARNRKTMKEDCRLQTSLAYAEKVF